MSQERNLDADAKPEVNSSAEPTASQAESVADQGTELAPSEVEAGHLQDQILEDKGATIAVPGQNHEDSPLATDNLGVNINSGLANDLAPDPIQADANSSAANDLAADKTEEKSTSALNKVDAAFAAERRLQAQEDSKDTGGKEMTFTAHLEELRMRLTRCLVGIFIGFLACYGFAEKLFSLLMNPLTSLLEPAGGSLIYTGLPEAFFTHLKVAAIAGFFLASPYVFYQLWMFVAPGLYEGERKWIIPIALCSALCFVTGALFGYFIVFPFGFQFFLSYTSEFIKPLPSVKEYFSFASGLLFAFGFIFELPLVMLFLSTLGLVTHKTLRKYRKYAILGNFIVGGILTPPDVISQLLMAGPLCLLYEVGIIVAMVFGKKPKEATTANEATSVADPNSSAEPKTKA